MYIARLETLNFSFEAAGYCEEAAIHALKDGWKRHAEMTGATHEPQDDEINVIELNPGDCIRDRETKVRDGGTPELTGLFSEFYRRWLDAEGLRQGSMEELLYEIDQSTDKGAEQARLLTHMWETWDAAQKIDDAK